MLEMWAIHLVARVAVRLTDPLMARRIVRVAARALPTLEVSEAPGAARRLEGSGTCLTRALAVAARVPGAEVVIGSDGLGDAFLAHAWAERDGVVLSATEPSRFEIARL